VSHSFLLIGQSNMAGRGKLAEAVPIDESRIFILRNGRFQKMFRPINPDRRDSGVNLAESFAEAYAGCYDTDVGLICCADGNSSLTMWQPGGVLFENAVFQAKQAMRASELKGILWHQGEADCAPERAAVYDQLFEPILLALREEFGELPLLVGGLGDFLKDCPLDARLKNYPLVNEGLRRIVDTHPMTGFVSAEGLRANPDSLHFNAASLHAFGLRYFEAYEALWGGNIRTESL